MDNSDSARLRHQWQTPISLDGGNMPSFPENVFPPTFQAFISDLARSTETPIELAALTVLSGISTAAQGKYVVQVKPDYYEPVNVWTVVGLPPGCRKSAVQKAVTAPLTWWELQQKLALEPLVAKVISRNKTLDMRLKEMRKMAASADEQKYSEIQLAIERTEAEVKDPPVIPQLWTTDITPENLGTLMGQNAERMSVISDEAGIFDILGGRYSQGVPNLDLFLQAHSGSPVRVNRGSRPPVLLERPTLTMGLTPQPEVLRGLTKVPSFRGRGLLGRFLYAVPRSNLGERMLDAAPLSAEIQSQYETAIVQILNQSGEDKNPHRLALSKEAYDAWHNFAVLVEVRMGDDGPFMGMRDWAGKLPGAVIRIAGLMHIARYAMGHPWSIEIGLQDMQAAITIGNVLSAHALEAFDLMGADAAMDGARMVLKLIQKNRWESFIFRDCHYALKSRFKRAKDLDPALEILEERHFILEMEKEKKAHRPSRYFAVNPQVYGAIGEER